MRKLISSGLRLPSEKSVPLSLAFANAAKNELELVQQTDPEDNAGKQAKEQKIQFLQQLLAHCRMDSYKSKFDMQYMIDKGDVASMERFLDSENKVYPYNYDGMELSSMLAYCSS